MDPLKPFDEKWNGNFSSVNDLLRHALVMLEQHNEQLGASSIGEEFFYSIFMQ